MPEFLFQFCHGLEHIEPKVNELKSLNTQVPEMYLSISRISQKLIRIFVPNFLFSHASRIAHMNSCHFKAEIPPHGRPILTLGETDLYTTLQAQGT